jgi:hypothetical protein
MPSTRPVPHASRPDILSSESACNPNPILCLVALHHTYNGDAIQGSPSETDSANEGAHSYICFASDYKWPMSFYPAARAYKQALATLTTFTALPSSRAFETHHQFSWHTGNSILSSFLPNPQGQGPLGSAIRIAIKLRHQSWLPRFLSSRLPQDSGRRRSDEELSGRAIKVLDLLQHAADLGHSDALFALGKISLVLLPYYPMGVVLSYFSSHLPHISLKTPCWHLSLLRHTLR